MQEFNKNSNKLVFYTFGSITNFRYDRTYQYRKYVNYELS